MTINTSENSAQHRVQFHGKAGEYFAIWLVNALLTIITLGIYSAWATVRRRRYFYGNTEINGDRFDYHAQPIQLLKGRLLVIGGIILFYIVMMMSQTLGTILALAFAALIPVIVIRNWRYNAIMSSYRGIRFNYHCQTGRAYWVLLLCPILLLLAFYIALVVVIMIGMQSNSPILMGFVALAIAIPGFAAVNGIMKMMQLDLYVNNLFFGKTAFKAELTKAAFIKFALISLLIFVPFLIAALSFMSSFFFSLFQTVAIEESEELVLMMLLSYFFNIVMMVVIMLLGVLVSSSYLVVAQRNYLFSQMSLNGGVKLHSSMQTMSYMGLLITNSLIIIFSLGWAAPVAEIRHARYLANATAVEGDLALLHVQAHQDTANSALAEEAVQALDLGVGL
ncbi:YjgN family protein [Pectobacterium betavasculorum]|uniref:Membrane protein n=1 Tax=Pectobacterium betavasculorum TaxID=55207 RepID=A0ABR4UZ58_9GAMM|nr:YjgN family protein [Pectobacterium betavasculorum]KFX20057.1 membrane protein [Pectobacterium betavasculorum]